MWHFPSGLWYLNRHSRGNLRPCAIFLFIQRGVLAQRMTRQEAFSEKGILPGHIQFHSVHIRSGYPSSSDFLTRVLIAETHQFKYSWAQPVQHVCPNPDESHANYYRYSCRLRLQNSVMHYSTHMVSSRTISAEVSLKRHPIR